MDGIETLSPTTDYSYSYSLNEIPGRSLSDAIKLARSKIAPFRFQLAARNISKELHLEGGERILEVGSGLGLLGKALKKEVAGDTEYVGIELAYKPAEKSKKANIAPVQADTISAPFANEAFDVVVSTDTLEHVSNSSKAVGEINRVLKPGGKAFIVIADPSEGRFHKVKDHIDRTHAGTDVNYWENLFEQHGFEIQKKNSEKYRKKDWRKIFNLPILVKLKNKPGFACAINPTNRPGTYILKKPKSQ